jgi:hypothetical protein
MHMTRTLPFFAAICIIMIHTGCEEPIPDPPDPGSFEWFVFDHPSLGYSLDYPSTITPERDGDDVFFRFEGKSLFRVSHVTEREGRERGLWITSAPIKRVKLGGRPGHLYIYRNFNGPRYSWWTAYVVEYRGKQLGVEFACKGDLGEVLFHVLESFRFHD